jgi:choline dehydrogenase-like flavoprotein
MHPQARHGPHNDIVDEQLRVRAIATLRIVDASILPTMILDNLTGPITAVS